MTKYLLSRLVRGLFSVVIVVIIVMLLIYTCLDRKQIFAQDPVWSHKKLNDKVVYELQQFEKYGYIDYVPYADFMQEKLKAGEITNADYKKAVTIARNASADSAISAQYIAEFTSYYQAQGYTVQRLNGNLMPGTTAKYKDGGRPALYAYKDISVFKRVFKYFGNLIEVDNIHYAEDEIEDRGLSFTLRDPVYGGEKFSPAIMGNGTKHKYLLYFDSRFPYIHQNLVSVNLGASYSIKKDVDVFEIMTTPQGAQEHSVITYPTGLREKSADDLHSATYISGSIDTTSNIILDRYVDNYTNVTLRTNGLSKMGYSFVIGFISVILSYLLAIPLGTLMARKKDKLVDKLGTFYIIFIIAVPSLAYIFLFRAIGRAAGLPDVFSTQNATWLMYILPIVSLALPSVAGLMKWLRRYMIDQMNSDYVKFARASGLSESEIFSRHIFKNAVIPIVHGIPGSVLGSLIGAIITESVYVVPGAGNLLTKSIAAYDNGVIVGLTLFYALLSVVSIILGDILMSMVDPRISFSSKGR